MKDSIPTRKLIDAYTDYCRDNYITYPDGRGSFEFYEGMMCWLKENGCDYRTTELHPFNWESESKLVEFILRYVK